MLDEQVKLSGVCSVTVIEQPPVEAVEAMFPNESVTWDVKLKVPVAVGVPLIKPLNGSNIRPGGRDPVGIENV